MALLTNIAVLLVLACFSHQLLLSSCQKSPSRRGKGADRGRDRNRGLRLGRQPKPVSPLPVKGKMVTGDKAECTWAATGDDLFTLAVTCRRGGRSFGCEYVATPAACPRYASSAKLYWKQIARALRKQENLCRDAGAQIRAGVCRGAAGDAHFRLRGGQRSAAPPASSAPATDLKSCQPANKKLAEEYCDESWSSFCTFLFTMVQDDGC